MKSKIAPRGDTIVPQVGFWDLGHHLHVRVGVRHVAVANRRRQVGRREKGTWAMVRHRLYPPGEIEVCCNHQNEIASGTYRARSSTSRHVCIVQVQRMRPEVFVEHGFIIPAYRQ